MQTNIESDLKKEKFELPPVPMKLMDTRKMTKKEKDKLKIKQDNLETCLLTLEIDENEFYSLLRDEPSKVKSSNSIFCGLVFSFDILRSCGSVTTA